jgi:hypothetical protein
MRIVILSLTILCLALSAPAFAGIIYTDGPTNGTVNAVAIDGPFGPDGQTISDGFVATNSGTAASLDFGVWVPGGTTPTSVTWSLGTSVFGSDISSGSTAQVGFTFLFTNGFGFNVYDAHVSGLSGNLVAGNSYWLTLGGANDSGGTQADYWDLNGGPASCDWAIFGAPQGDCGFTPPEGEAFTINGGSTVPEPGSMMMFGTGVLGLAGVLRRRMTL